MDVALESADILLKITSMSAPWARTQKPIDVQSRGTTVRMRVSATGGTPFVNEVPLDKVSMPNWRANVDDLQTPSSTAVNCGAPGAGEALDLVRRSFVPLMSAHLATPPAAPAERHYSALLVQLNGGHYANALRTCERLLRLDSSDTLARQTKVQLLIAMERYAAALALTTDTELELERAYCLYQTGREAQVALQVDSRGAQVLQAQAVRSIPATLLTVQHYRLAQYDAARDLYDELVATSEPVRASCEFWQRTDASRARQSWPTSRRISRHARLTLTSSRRCPRSCAPRPRSRFWSRRRWGRSWRRT